MAKNKRKSQNQEVQTPKKQKLKEENDKTPKSNIKNTPQKQNNTTKNQEKNAQKEKLQKFSGTTKIDPKIEEDANSSGESDYEVEHEVKPEKITKTMNEDNSDSDAEANDSEDGADDNDATAADDDASVDDDSSDDDEKEEIDNAVNENSENDEKKHEKKNSKTNVDKIGEIKAFIENETAKGKMRYVLFLGNLPYDTTTEEIKTHFKDGIEIKSVRIPIGQGPNKKPRGFGYLEVTDKESYLKAFSMHHTFLKGRRINVQYTTGGKKNSANTKSIIKKKNFKLNALRKDGKLEGCKKPSQKRSVRRAKKRSFEKKTE